MKAFAALYRRLDESNRTNDKVAAMAAFFAEADPADAAWTVHFLVGRRPRRAVSSTKMQAWAAELAGIPLWLFQECYDAAGDLAEAIAAVVPEPEGATTELSLTEWVERRLMSLGGLSEEAQKPLLQGWWREVDRDQRFVLNKLITGAFRVGVSQELVVRALAQASGIPGTTLAHRLMGDWQPTREFFAALVSPETGEAPRSRPYPFCLAHPLETEPSSLGEREAWHAEWKWDGIRAQVLRRQGESYVWSRGEELITERFPEIRELADRLPDGTVVDGEILAWGDGKPRPFLDLQKRIGRKSVSKKLLAEVPVVLQAFDLLEIEGRDLRDESLAGRLEALRRLAEEVGMQVSPAVEAGTWEALAEARETARELGVEGLMLKRLDSPYQVGRKRGAWWKWKIAPMTVDAVLIYAQRGSGKRASLYTDYTFALWDGDQLVPFAKAYSGLDDAEIRKVDAWVRRNTLEKFGPVRSVTPELVMELAFEGIQLSSRHKCGVAVRFPRIARWRHDKKPADADRLETLKEALAARGGSG